MLKSKRNFVLSAALAALCATGGSAMAANGHWGGHGGHWGGGWGWGAGAVIGSAIVAGALLSPYYYRPYYYSPYYYSYPAYPTVVEYAPSAPTVYYQQPAAPAAVAPAAPADSGNWWYYCNDSKTYYPYVQSCASGWQRVSPQAPR